MAGEESSSPDPQQLCMPPLPPWVVVHIPHDSTRIGGDFRNQFLLTDAELEAELLRMTDHWTFDLFAEGVSSSQVVYANLSRLIVDVERFEDDALEPMASRGMGAIYERTSDGRQLRRPLMPDERRELMSWYEHHHARLFGAVQRSLREQEKVLVMDAHSFSSIPLPHEPDQRPDRPQICIGTDEFHTPPEVAEAFLQAFRNAGFIVALNAPFSGAMVPMPYYQKDRRVVSVMIEVNRALYMVEATGQRGPDFTFVAESIRHCVLSAISNL